MDINLRNLVLRDFSLIFSSLSDSKSFSRNSLIEEAIDKFLEESEKFLHDEHGINVDALFRREKI